MSGQVRRYGMNMAQMTAIVDELNTRLGVSEAQVSMQKGVIANWRKVGVAMQGAADLIVKEATCWHDESDVLAKGGHVTISLDNLRAIITRVMGLDDVEVG